MILKNTSRYPDAEVRLLVGVGARAMDARRVAIVIKNSSRGYRGLAYRGVPHLSPFRTDRRVDYLVTVGIGRPEHFPLNNDHTRRHTRPLTDWTSQEEIRAHPRYGDADVGTEMRHADQWRLVQHTTSQGTYGGKDSPCLEYRDWREALVAVTAHELCHIEQFRTGRRASEAECEYAAADALDRWRNRPPVAG